MSRKKTELNQSDVDVDNVAKKGIKNITPARVIKLVRNVFISFIVLVMLAAGVGVVYTWYIGRNGMAEAEDVTNTVEVESRIVIEPAKPTANSVESVSVQMLTSPIVPGSNASVTVKTLAGSNCKILVEYNKIASKDSGLVQKIADEFGMASWTWTVENSVPLGTWPVTVTCSYGARSAVVIGDLVVSPTATEEN